jgi:L-lactate dehydrogenase complex protein LldF
MSEDISSLTAEARRVLREKFLAAGMGISGGNIGVAETGSIVIVTNEGNGRMVTSLPPIHVVVMGIEKIVPSWDEAAVWLSLLARSATGQPLSIYTNVITGPARPEDVDGPREVHIILLDNNRARLVGTKYEEVLECIRCGACLNICPVYREAGGHAYSSPYSGPIGAVITPLLYGIREYNGLPQASSLCGACLDVCPARIDLPRMLLALREDEVDRRVVPLKDRFAERLAAWILAQPKLFDGLLRLAGKMGLTKVMQPFMKVKIPQLAERSFHVLWREGEVE